MADFHTQSEDMQTLDENAVEEHSRNSQSRHIARAPKNQWGYSISQVDEFLNSARTQYEAEEPSATQEEIQNTSFDLEKNGYDTKAVDDALRRLENAVVDKLARWTILNDGTQAWIAQTEQLALTLIARAKREKGKTFTRARRFTPSYDVRQVDSFVRAVVRYIDTQLSLGALGQSVSGQSDNTSTSHRVQDTQPSHFSSQDVELMTFTQRSGHHGYDEAQVDAYLNRIRQVLTRMESTVRVQDIDHLSSVDEYDSAFFENMDSTIDSSLSSLSANNSRYADVQNSDDDDDSFEELEELVEGENDNGNIDIENNGIENDHISDSAVNYAGDFQTPVDGIASLGSMSRQDVEQSEQDMQEDQSSLTVEHEPVASVSLSLPESVESAATAAVPEGSHKETPESSEAYESSDFEAITRTEERMFGALKEDIPQSFVPEHKPERGSTRTNGSVDYSTLMDTGSIQSVPFHLPNLDNDARKNGLGDETKE
ncbi:DivIVA domain-containing protein [Alloscardovia theropitheci]|uniref:DivIVA domain-containing protein n=1 Tax=Alloscardovia theropitheci TaxID=2496842 RepID=A0A4R0QV54_9BIFI|nr:DivIVA domain-containing protein [Alloscardovia theropitheci]TCD54007.1 DivIVA domain-containing protein [Alloscardovia theropitheci]